MCLESPLSESPYGVVIVANAETPIQIQINLEILQHRRTVGEDEIQARRMRAAETSRLLDASGVAQRRLIGPAVDCPAVALQGASGVARVPSSGVVGRIDILLTRKKHVALPVGNLFLPSLPMLSL